MMNQPIYLLSTATLPDHPVTAAGITLEVIPFIDIEYINAESAIPETAVFTSLNAVIAVRRWLTSPPPYLRIYCIGGTTNKAVVEAFGEKSVVGKAASAGDLAKLILAREKGDKKKIVFFCGDQRREDLPSIGVTEKIVYRTVPTPHRLNRTYDGIAFFSPSAVESFFSVNAIATGIPLFAIGATTAAAIRATCRNQVITGSEPDKSLLIREMIDFFHHKP